jgi:hypothetical protein
LSIQIEKVFKATVAPMSTHKIRLSLIDNLI